MKRNIYISRQASVFIPQDYLLKKNLKTGVHKFRINNTHSIGRLIVIKKLNKSGKILFQGFFSIPKNVTDYLKLKNKQEVDFDIENGK